jgi:hypothetical protein
MSCDYVLFQIVEEPSMDPAEAPWTGEARRERVVALGVLHFLALENIRDAHVLFRSLKKVRNKVSIYPCVSHVIIISNSGAMCLIILIFG